MGAYSCRVPILVWVLTIGTWLNWVPIFMGCLLSMGAYYPDSTVIVVDYADLQPFVHHKMKASTALLAGIVEALYALST